jgi:hypothetical protein
VIGKRVVIVHVFFLRKEIQNTSGHALALLQTVRQQQFLEEVEVGDANKRPYINTQVGCFFAQCHQSDVGSQIRNSKMTTGLTAGKTTAERELMSRSQQARQQLNWWPWDC